MNLSFVVLIFILPLLVFAVLGLAGMYLRPRLAGLLATSITGIVFLLSLLTAWIYFRLPVHSAGIYQPVIPVSFEWLRFSDRLVATLGILLDPVAVMMLVVVSFVSLMVHWYSLGYMQGEKGFQRYYAFLSLFTFSMMSLVITTNLVQMYIFWELVGISSYLLIGFYYTRPAAIAAAKKAFIVTRFADLGFLIGILLLSYYAGTFDFGLIVGNHASSVGVVSSSFAGLKVVEWAMLLVFMGAAGKSAMFPLHIWLPDAMEGPTPVSALIHAATMVVAGVYLIARMFPVYYFHAPAVLSLIAYTGAFTSLFAAIIACTQTDIKRVLAFSTLSQIGYMMLSLGVSGYGQQDSAGYTASLFHLFTHAMFKSLLFLAAGAVIHAVHENSILRMGGLRKYMPSTHFAFLVGCLAIAGIPFFSGFYSKEEILIAAWEHHKALFFVAWLVAGLTAFYMFRLYFTVFWGRDRYYHHPVNEAPRSMRIPLLVLSFISIVAGYVPFGRYVSAAGHFSETHFYPGIAIASVTIALIGILIAMKMYARPNAFPEKLTKKMGLFYVAACNRFYIDEGYLFITKKIIFNLIAHTVAWVDRHVVDGMVNAIAKITEKIAFRIRKMQDGQVQEYGLIMAASATGLALLLIYLATN